MLKMIDSIFDNKMKIKMIYIEGHVKKLKEVYYEF